VDDVDDVDDVDGVDGVDRVDDLELIECRGQANAGEEFSEVTCRSRESGLKVEKKQNERDQHSGSGQDSAPSLQPPLPTKRHHSGDGNNDQGGGKKI